VLALLDLSRPYLGTEPFLLGRSASFFWIGLQSGVFVLGIGSLCGVLRSRGYPLKRALPLLALGLLFLPTYLYHSRSMESDGIHYYAQLRSVLFDQDLDLRNDYALLGWEHPNTQNVLPVGAPILWSPFVGVVHLGRQLARLFGAGPPTGIEPLYQGAVCLATLAYGATGLFVLFFCLRHWVGSTTAFWTTLLCWIGSPLRFYLSVLPGLAHGVEFFAAALVLRYYLALREGPGPMASLRVGAACGLLFLTRSQDGVLLALPALELAFLLRWRPADLGRMALALVGGFVLVALPQLVVWQIAFGTPLLIPHKVIHGAEFMHLDRPELVGTLLSPRGGLFASYPAMLLGVMGLGLLAMRDRRYVVALLPPLLLGWYVNSTIFDWYHVRRFTGVVPFIGPGLARILRPVVRAGVLPMGVISLLFGSYDLALHSLRKLPGEPAPVHAVLGEVCDGLAETGYALLERATPRVSVALLRAYTGEELLAEDVTSIDFGRETPALRLPKRARHLSSVEVEDGVACRWVRSREARLFLALASESSLNVTLRAHALETQEEQALEVLWNEVSLGSKVMGPGWQDYRFTVPQARVGTNVVVMRFSRAPIFHRVRGWGAREIRPAALASITFHRSKG